MGLLIGFVDIYAALHIYFPFQIDHTKQIPNHSLGQTYFMALRVKM